MDKQHAYDLLKRYEEGTCSEEEKKLIEHWFLQLDRGSDQREGAQITSSIWARIQQHRQRSLRRARIQWTAAACLLFVFAGALSYWYVHSGTVFFPKEEHFTQTIDPGKNRATLTLTNGEQIQLDENKSGIIFHGDRYTYSDGETLLPASETTLGSVQEATLSTPKGGQYQLLLSDGTKVWLNAESSISYPLSFSAGTRTVKLQGEAYFEVAHNPKGQEKTSPFTVITESQKVEVLGTDFNISAYLDEHTTETTLIAGRVKVTRLQSQESSLLHPKQQSTISASQEGIGLKIIDPEEVISWKNGYFSFDHTRLGEIMKKIARWYDVEVRFDDPKLEDELFNGSISRYEQAEQVLEVLALTEKVNFHIQGHTIRISKGSLFTNQQQH